MMTRQKNMVPTSWLILLFTLLFAVPAAGAEPTPFDVNRQGPLADAAFREGRYQEAADLYRAWYGTTRERILLKNIGKCHLHLGHQAEARREPALAHGHWQRSRESYNAYLTSGIAAAEQSEVRAVLTLLDEQLRATAPAVEPPGGREPPPPSAPWWQRRSTWGVALLGVGLVTAGGLLVQYGFDARDYDRCREDGNPTCDETYSRDMTLQLVGAGAGGALAVGGLVLLLTGKEDGHGEDGADGPTVGLVPWGLGFAVVGRR